MGQDSKVLRVSILKGWALQWKEKGLNVKCMLENEEIRSLECQYDPWFYHLLSSTNIIIETTNLMGNFLFQMFM